MYKYMYSVFTPDLFHDGETFRKEIEMVFSLSVHPTGQNL